MKASLGNYHVYNIVGDVDSRRMKQAQNDLADSMLLTMRSFHGWEDDVGKHPFSLVSQHLSPSLKENDIHLHWSRLVVVLKPNRPFLYHKLVNLLTPC